MIRRARFVLLSVMAMALACAAQNYRYANNGIIFSGNGTQEPFVCFESSFNSGADICLSRSAAGVLGATDGLGNPKAVTAATLASTVATGTAPLTVASTTPVANLTAVPTTYTAAGTQQTAVHIVTGSVTLASGAGTLTLSGAAAFTSSTTYACSATDNTAANAVKLTQSSGTSISLTGTTTDAISVVCVGS